MSHYAAQPPSFSIADILRGMAKRKLLMTVCLALGILGGLGIVKVVKPRYLSEALILIDNQTTPFDGASSVQEQRVALIDDRMVQSQIAVLKSEDLGRRVIESLQLSGNGEFESLSKRIGPLGSFMIATGFNDDPRLMTPEQRAYKRFSSQLTVYQVPQSDVIGVKYTAADGKTAATVANALAELYVHSTREQQSGTTDRAREWLSQQIAGLRTMVSASEAAVEKFRSEAGLVKGQSTTLGTQEISELNSQITLAEAARSEAQARADAIRELLETQGSVDASADVLNSGTVQRLRELQIAANGKLSELSATYLPSHPKIIAAQQEATNIDRQVRREALKIVESLQGQAKIAAARAKSLRKSLEEMKGREGGAAQSDVKLKELEREANANRALLETMLARYADVNARQDLNLQPGTARIIQRASVAASPYYPKAGPTVLLLSLAGLGLGLGLAFLLEIMAQAARLNETAFAQFNAHRPVHPAAAAENAGRTIPELPVPGVAAPATDAHGSTAPDQHAARPVVNLRPPVVASLPAVQSFATSVAWLADPANATGTAEPIASITSSLNELHTGKNAKAFCFVSVGGTHDAAFACVAVARQLAARGVKTLVIDVDPQRPSVADMLSLPDGPGLAELVMGTADVSRVIQLDPLSTVQLIRFGGPNGDDAAKAVSNRMDTILTSLGDIYGMMLIHAGEAGLGTPRAVQGSNIAVFLAPTTRQGDAAAAAATLAQQGILTSLFVKLEQSPTRISVRAVS